MMEQELERQRATVMLLEQVIQQTAHQIRHPLSLIELYADVLMELDGESVSAETVRSHITHLHDAADDLGQHIERLAAYGLQGKIRLEPTNLHSIWLESVHRVRLWIDEKHIQIITPSCPVEVPCDRWQIGQVFDNLLRNAIHFSPEGGTITCQWHPFQGEVLIEVSDQGQGIPDQDLQKVFTPFYSQRSGGSGIGLAVVRKIVLDHQGQCWMQNLPEGGAKVSFTLKC